MPIDYARFCVRVVMPAVSAKPPGIFPFVYMSTCLVIGPLTLLNIYKILSNAALHALVTVSVSYSVDHTSTTFQRKIKEAIHIQWEKSTLNHQLYHVNLKLSL